VASLCRPSSARTAERVLDFFTSNVRNPNTRKAYARAVSAFAAWCEHHGLADLGTVRPFHIATYIEELGGRIAAPSVKLQLAAIRMLFDWLVVGQIVPMNPASAVRGPRHVVKKGKTPVLSAEETRTLLDSIDVSTPAGLRDRALIASSSIPSPASARPRRSASKTFIHRVEGHGSGSTKKAASVTTCRVTTRWTVI
jgi:site-specific recombinase XerD